MGYKAIKEKFKIEHTVHVDGNDVCIGSAYINDIIRINPEGKIIKGRNENHNNADLKRYLEEMTVAEKTGYLKFLFHKPDTFSELTTVYTTSSCRVIKTACEVYGWPNVTVTGEKMYDNTFFRTYKEARVYLLRDSQLGVKFAYQNVIQAFRDSRILRSIKHLSGAIYVYIFARIIRKSNNFI